MTGVIRIATRRSRLALWQAEHVASRLRDLGEDIEVSLVPMSTRGDEILDRSLAKIGGKGLFIKELEVAIRNGTADIAVHSMKDVPFKLPDGMSIACVLERADPRDALVAWHADSLDELPQGASVGTSSLRRRAQLKYLRPDLNIVDLRGNVETRLSRVSDGDLDAAILAAAGLHRLELSDRIRSYLPPGTCLPAVGQGVIGIECREAATSLRDLLVRLEHTETRVAVAAERAFARRLEGSCQSPIAAHASFDGDRLVLRGRVAQPDGSLLIDRSIADEPARATAMGVKLAEEILEHGGAEILAALRVGDTRE